MTARSREGSYRNLGSMASDLVNLQRELQEEIARRTDFKLLSSCRGIRIVALNTVWGLCSTPVSTECC